MTTYSVKHTDINETAISVNETEIDDTSLDITLFGRIKQEYGQLLNENLLHILENFACPQDPATSGDYPANPDISIAIDELLSAPTKGQFWWNSTNSRMYVWKGDEWIPIGMRGDYAANWGQIYHGEQLPRPVSAYTAYEFPYEECIWSVSPANYLGKFDYMACSTNISATVTMQYRLFGSSTILDGVVNYLIIGIKGNSNNGTLSAPPSP